MIDSSIFALWKYATTAIEIKSDLFALLFETFSINYEKANKFVLALDFCLLFFNVWWKINLWICFLSFEFFLAFLYQFYKKVNLRYCLRLQLLSLHFFNVLSERSTFCFCLYFWPVFCLNYFNKRSSFVICIYL